MKLPRDLSADELVKALEQLGYTRTRQVGSHIRLTTQRGGEHHVTIPRHNVLKVGTLNAILKDVANQFGLSREELLKKLFS